MEFLENQDVEVMYLPFKSHAMNPIENVWDQMAWVAQRPIRLRALVRSALHQVRAVLAHYDAIDPFY